MQRGDDDAPTGPLQARALDRAGPPAAVGVRSPSAMSASTPANTDR